MNFQSVGPREFSKCVFEDFSYYKATELRMFLLYLYRAILRKHLKRDYMYFNHFLLLHFAIYVLCSNRLTPLHFSASKCLELFVQKCKRFFRSRFLTYNLHVLTHLSEFSEMYGCLDNWSTFSFESFLNFIKRTVKRTPHLYQHLKNILGGSEKNVFPSEPSSVLFCSCS